MPLLREISKNNDKESHKTTGSVQAYTDAATRDREERDYYKQRFSAQVVAKPLLQRGDRPAEKGIRHLKQQQTEGQSRIHERL